MKDIAGDGYGAATLLIDTDALADNYLKIEKYVSSVSSDTRVMAVVKADAYGHGTDICVPVLSECGCEHFAVATLDEALKVERALAGRKAEILIFQNTSPRLASVLCEHGFLQSVSSEEYARALELSLGKGQTLPIHIKLNTGMNRMGFDSADPESTVEGISALLSECGALNVRGIFSHLYAPDNRRLSGKQLELFRGVCDGLSACGVSVGMRHLAASGGVFASSEYYFDAVRPGICLYGYGAPSGMGLTPVMELYGRVVGIRSVKRGENVGYGECRIDRDSVLLTVSGGYADGIMRAFSGADVMVMTESGEVSAHIFGRVCMDCFMAVVDETEGGHHIKLGDRVEVFGKRRNLSFLAACAGTIEYECLTSAARARGGRYAINNK